MKYRLNKAQLEFFNTKDKYAAICSGLGGGKSFVLQLLCIVTALKYPDALHCYVSLSYSLLRDATIPSMFRMLEDMEIPYEYVKSENCVILNGKTQIILRSEDTAERLRSVEIGSLFCDEIAYFNKMNFMTLVGRLRDKNGPMIMRAATTPKGKNWFYNLFIEEQQGKVIRASSRDNKHLPEGYLETLEKNYDSKLRRQEVEGEFLAASESLAYYFFNEKHVMPVHYKRELGTVYVGMDFNVSKLCAVLFQLDGQTIRVFDEICLTDSNTFVMARTLQQRIASLNHSGSVVVVPDSTGNARKTSSTKTDHQILREAGFSLPVFRNPLRHDRFNCMNMLLEQGHIIIDDGCKVLLKDFREFDGIEEHGNLGHMSDALGYPIWMLRPIKKPTFSLNSRIL